MINEENNDDLALGRETVIEIVENSEAVGNTFAVCLQTDDEKLLIPLKLYQVEMRGERVLVTDEDNERAVYPADHFMPVKLDPVLESVLLKVA
jgi:hypothetical protein